MSFTFTSCKIKPGEGSSYLSINIPKDYPVEIGSVTITKCPQKVISLSPSLTEIIFSLGSDSQLFGVSDYCDFPEKTSLLKKFGTSNNPKTDEIIAEKPDAVLTDNSGGGLADRLSSHGIPVVVIEGAATIVLLKQVYIDVGTVMSGINAGEKNAVNTFERIEEKLIKISGKSKNKPEVKAALILSFPEAIATGNTMIGSLLKYTGAKNVAENASNYDFGIDKLIAADPDYIFCDARDVEKIKTALPNTAAVKNGKVIPVDIPVLERGGDRIVGVVEKMAFLVRS